MFNPYQQSMPYVPNYQQSQTPPCNVSWVYVNGIEGARSQIVQPNQTSWMMDNNDPVIYVKAVDGMGTASLRVFRLEEINNSTPNHDGFATQADLDAVKSKLEEIEKVLGGLNT